MITPEIISYVKTEQAKGTPDPAIKSNLLANGWSDKDISEAMAALSASATSGVPTRSAATAETKKFRSKRKWIIFSVWTVIYILLSLGSIRSGGFFGVLGGNSFLWSLGGLLVVYAAAHIASMGIEPKDKKWKEIVDLIIRIIGAGALILVLDFAILFASCLFLASTGGLKGL